ncbi:hypothetical protein [Nocardioides sp. TF02-7]|uniref:hypothetical protein n=1 Tax=Nocardioides sp. TF02-7 TaxID=2917724 RepID=UPI001F05F385|nr:hypothetical protein [Nocardioides sp. TF02-7]UMG91005.1 hypothetical protein MF408_12245 [Nocardioides sp. TF02-7]
MPSAGPPPYPPAGPPPYPPGPPAGPPAARGSTAKVLAVGGVVVALIAAGVVIWQFVWPRGGAGSPEEAVEQLVLASAEQDPVAVLDMLSPAEVDGLDDLYDTARERAEEEGGCSRATASPRRSRSS